jgi:aryl-alcohol dehydrogenase-like predicted oxidoreductase
VEGKVRAQRAGGLPADDHPRVDVGDERDIDEPLTKVVQAFDSPYDEPINAVQKLAEKRSVSMAEIALAWVLRNPLVSAPIVGASNPTTVAALELELTDEEVRALEEPYHQYGPSSY